MPSYNYRCKSCNHTFETVQSITEDPLKTCPECPGETYRVIGKNIGIKFIGSGFYVNDSKSSAPAEKTTEKSTASSSPSK